MENNFKIENLRDGDNWDTWKLVISNLLDNEDGSTFDVCEGTLIKPEVPDTSENAAYKASLEKFQKADRIARKTIVTTLVSKPLRLITGCTTARQMWEKLHATFELKSSESLSLIMQMFYGFKWDDNLSVVENITKIEQLNTKMKIQGKE